MKWTSACGSLMTEENLYYLACKAFRNNNLPETMEEVNKLQLSWSLFCKENLPGRDFTFWEWFLKTLILTKCHLATLWKENHVKGFVSKESAESILKDKPAGTFLIRFSDSEFGGVTIAFAGQPGCKCTFLISKYLASPAFYRSKFIFGPVQIFLTWKKRFRYGSNFKTE